MVGFVRMLGPPLYIQNWRANPTIKKFKLFVARKLSEWNDDMFGDVCWDMCTRTFVSLQEQLLMVHPSCG